MVETQPGDHNSLGSRDKDQVLDEGWEKLPTRHTYSIF